MSQPELTYGVHSSDDLPSVQPGELVDGDRTPQPHEHSAPFQADIRQLYDANRQKDRRIHQLEQALDQALACLEDVRSRVHDQLILQDKLEIAEECVYVQYRAIERLKLELYERLQEQQSLEMSLHRSQGVSFEQSRMIVTLQQDAALAQNKVEELETEVAKQLKSQARWQHRYQELQEEHQICQVRLEDLEQHQAEMQEQILAQARQASEFEAAIQHWKDRYFANQRQLAQLKGTIERSLSAQSESDNGATVAKPVLLELLAMIQLVMSVENEESHLASINPSTKFTTLDVPDFLLRRLTSRIRGTQSHEPL
ncbi:MAG: hypothetical protein ACFE0I_17710 [Elainellaceae cyanobacterium]